MYDITSLFHLFFFCLNYFLYFRELGHTCYLLLVVAVGVVAGWTAPCLLTPRPQRRPERRQTHGLHEQLAVVASRHPAKAAAAAFTGLDVFFM